MTDVADSVGSAPAVIETHQSETPPQLDLFGGSLPEASGDGAPFRSISVHFESMEDIAAFARLMDLPITTQTKWLQYPPLVVRGKQATENPAADPQEASEEVSSKPGAEVQTIDVGQVLDVADGSAQLSFFGESEAPPPAVVRSGPFQSVYVHFENRSDVEAFARLVGQPVTSETRQLVFPADPSLSVAWRSRPPAVEEQEEDLGWTKDDQLSLAGMRPFWEDHWHSMPEFVQENKAPWHTIQVDFATSKDVADFARLIDQPITPMAKRTRSVWYPEAEIGRFADKRYVSTAPLNPRYPVYIISKGRWESRMTSKALEKMGVPYHIVVEPQERDQYAAVIDPAKIHILPFSNLGQGSIPARNWVWEHAAKTGARRHWILDDNIEGFFRLNRNLKTPVADGTIFRCAEDFVDRYENVAIAGFHYFMFASRKTKMPPFTLNSRVYSMILIRNDLRLGVDGVGQWRGRYNEDTDLSLRALKDGWCTVLFLAFLGFKATTMTMKGGNTDELYKDDGRKKMAESLAAQHPDVTKVVWKWGRWQHHVDYSRFKNTLRAKPGARVQEQVNDFGMYLQVDS